MKILLDNGLNVTCWRLLKKRNFENIDGSRIFNTDETVLLLNSKEGSVLAKRESKNIYDIVNNNSQEYRLILFMAKCTSLLSNGVKFNWRLYFGEWINILTFSC